ncbi:MAG: hypothetical protein EOO68_03895 [Moraxellaceae bacterium]|nr:MAG: hypothetical protein EOO68_03895 [Moraxellaceae bacterium]
MNVGKILRKLRKYKGVTQENIATFLNLERTTYAKLEKDPRHTDLKVLSVEPITQRGFLSWEMKYAQIDQEVRGFLKNHQLGKFDPYRFSPEMTAELVALLQKADEGLSDGELRNSDGGSEAHASSGVSMSTYLISIVIAVVLTAIVTLWITGM